MVVAAIDPGREKCGLAVVAGDGRVLDQAVVATTGLIGELSERIRRFSPTLLLIGNGTTSHDAQTRIRKAMPDLSIEEAEEYRTTDDARRAYWEANPPSGWRRFFPTGMQVPPVPVDDYVAVLLARRYLARWSGK